MRVKGEFVYDHRREPFDVELDMSSMRGVPPVPGMENLPANPYEGEALSDTAQLGLSRLPETRPLFVLTADDLIAPTLVRLWADLMKFDKNSTIEERAMARRTANAMEEWQRSRGLVP